MQYEIYWQIMALYGSDRSNVCAEIELMTAGIRSRRALYTHSFAVSYCSSSKGVRAKYAICDVKAREMRNIKT
ncbi:hypothetical protein [Candidatus Anaplasma sp. TIGMIC]|uniref:hypothetical protein n=1 Tax=Candidatus Anaplasma sp. TIGMIC TaxID=3020713 RepID=UPI00232DDDC8|nr:hypothetical protein [Candidatus Anaplasma sp. TIGMIC]MDB1135437.1 hypothetical protein [Candidatus Anaplasma sp. TIGMIC]